MGRCHLDYAPSLPVRGVCGSDGMGAADPVGSASGPANCWVPLSSHPCLPCCWCRYKQQGPFAPRTLLRFFATADPSVTLSPFPRLPVFAGYTGSCSADFATGRGGLLQLLGASLSSCCRYRPARVSRRIGQLATLHAAFALSTGARPLR